MDIVPKLARHVVQCVSLCIQLEQLATGSDLHVVIERRKDPLFSLDVSNEFFTVRVGVNFTRLAAPLLLATRCATGRRTCKLTSRQTNQTTYFHIIRLHLKPHQFFTI